MATCASKLWRAVQVRVPVGSSNLLSMYGPSSTVASSTKMTSIHPGQRAPYVTLKVTVFICPFWSENGQNVVLARVMSLRVT